MLQSRAHTHTVTVGVKRSDTHSDASVVRGALAGETQTHQMPNTAKDHRHTHRNKMETDTAFTDNVTYSHYTDGK